MNKTLFYSIILMASFGIYAQEEDNITKVELVKDSSNEYAQAYGKHEVRLNALDLVVHPALHLYYERIVNESSGYGASLFVNFGDYDATYQSFAFSPYYRFYFLNRKDFGASGLFVEVFSTLASANFDDFSSAFNDEDHFMFSMGVGAGKKWVNRSGFSFEVFAGVGRYFNQLDRGPEAHGRFGLSVGKRF